MGKSSIKRKIFRSIFLPIFTTIFIVIILMYWFVYTMLRDSIGEDHKVSEEVGADAYVTKPFDPKALLGKIEETLEIIPKFTLQQC